MLIAFLTLGLVWLGVYALKRALEYKYGVRRVNRWMKNRNMTISPGFVSIFTHDHVPHIHKWVFGKRKRIQRWFTLGVYVTVPIILLSILVQGYSVWQYLSVFWGHWSREPGVVQETNQTPSTASTPLMEPLIPGLNVPGIHIVFIFIALAISAIFHEFGHAIAAVSEHIDIGSAGMFVFVLYPGAYVEFDQESPNSDDMGKLRTYIAGSWHNCVVALSSLLILFVIGGIFTVTPDDGIPIVGLTHSDPFQGVLNAGDKMMAINGMEMRNVGQVEQYLLAVHHQRQSTRRFCVSESQIGELKVTPRMGCCNDQTLDDMQCYRSVDNANSFHCLNAKHGLKPKMCATANDCGDQALCLNLDSRDDMNATERFLIHVEPGNRNVLLMGNVADLLTIEFGTFQGRFSWNNGKWFYNVWLVFQLFFEYLASMSMGLAVLNLTPVFHLDGQWCTRVLLRLVFPNQYYSTRERISNIILWMGTTITALNMILMVASASMTT